MTHANDAINESIRAELIALGSATLGESGAEVLSQEILPMWKGAQFAGPAATVSCVSGDNLAIHAAVAHASRGSVLGVSFAGYSVRGYWGEVLTTAAEAAGLIALVIDGHVRDVAAIERHGFPVFARGVALQGAGKVGPGQVGGPIVLGGALVRPGDWLVGDADGVVVIDRGQLKACRDAGAARAAKEGGFFDRLRAGATTTGLLSLDLSPIDILPSEPAI